MPLLLYTVLYFLIFLQNINVYHGGLGLYLLRYEFKKLELFHAHKEKKTFKVKEYFLKQAFQRG